MDGIIIKDLRMEAIIGVRERERHTPQEIIINIFASTKTRRNNFPDDISVCLDYSELVKLIREKVISSQRFTIEALAEDLAALCLENKKVMKVMVRVEKPLAITGAASVGVEIVRKRIKSKL